MKKLIFLYLLCFKSYAVFAGIDTLSVREHQSILISNKYFTQLEDPTKKLSAQAVVKSDKFVNCESELPILKFSNAVLWLKIILHNGTTQPYIPITINTSVIDHFDLYYQSSLNHAHIHLPPVPINGNRGFFDPSSSLINCSILPDSTKTIYLRIQSNVPYIIPIEFSSANQYWKNYNSQNTAFIIFIGIAVIMILYNFLLFFIVQDKTYLYYIFYVILFSFSQGLTRGYGHQFMNSEAYNNYLIPTIRVSFWISVIAFVNQFLQLKNAYPSIYKYYRCLYLITVLPLFFLLINKANFFYSILTFNAMFISIVLLITGGWLYTKGIQHAKFFMIAWTLFLVSILITIASNKNLIPYNNLTANAVVYSAILELVLFSVALADKINFYRRQNTESQMLALKIARENEKLITTQNISLETRVLERTKELLQTNTNLLNMVENLKSAQNQLIETEKMASLGQLTAGIAHEINNPINFVRSNIKPLKLDLSDLFILLDKYAEIEKQVENKGLFKATIDYKEKIDLKFVKKEITDLLDGIEEGASRTAEIVQSLRVFSRTDEVELKPVDVNKSILNTLVLLRNTIPYYIEITPVFEKLKPLNCYPGKLNQVFMNLIHNSIQAIKEKKRHYKESILIATKDYPENITIEITDTGTGIADEVKQKIFDPFFTTKDVGEGTGLGLSIVFGIIEKHHGAIDVKSEPGKGTTFIIMLPKTLS